VAYDTALAALADPTRRRVFERLRSGPKPVIEIAHGMPVSRPAVSQHLKVLKEAGLVREQRYGAKRVYAIDPDGLGPLRRWLDQLWDSALDSFQVTVEAEAASVPKRTKHRGRSRR
jgi:DNA-binding transcriptional ArsR family regulator